VYVANYADNTVTPIDTATDTTGAPIRVSASPHLIAISLDQAPVAHLSVTPAVAGQPTVFNASASTVAFGTISAYAWVFGDGSTATTSTSTTAHLYATPRPLYGHGHRDGLGWYIDDEGLYRPDHEHHRGAIRLCLPELHRG
jgi:YVTN family beta-propeller protein